MRLGRRECLVWKAGVSPWNSLRPWPQLFCLYRLRARPGSGVPIGWERPNHPDSSPLPFTPHPYSHTCVHLPHLAHHWPGTHLTGAITHCHIATHTPSELLIYLFILVLFFQLTDRARTYLCSNTHITIQSGHKIPMHEIRSFANYLFNNSSA